MGSEQGRNHGPQPSKGGVANRLQRFEFRFDGEAVSGFGLDGSRPMRSHVSQRTQNFSREFGFARFAHPIEARADTSARLRDIFIGGTFNSLLEVHQTRLYEDRMGMRVDESGEDDLASAVDLGDCLSVCLQPGIVQGIFGLADGHDLSANAEYRTVMKNAEFSQIGSTPGAALVSTGLQCQQLADVDQQQ